MLVRRQVATLLATSTFFALALHKT